jgi:hypothetical protein
MELLAGSISSLVLTMKASGTTYAAEINKATSMWGVDQALLQSIIEVGGTEGNVAGIPEGAKRYAASYANNRGHEGEGHLWAEANVVASAWWIVYLYRQYDDIWSAIKAYFEMSPVGEAKMNRIYNVSYPKWRKAWRNT